MEAAAPVFVTAVLEPAFLPIVAGEEDAQENLWEIGEWRMRRGTSARLKMTTVAEERVGRNFTFLRFHFYTGDGEDPTIVSEKTNRGAHVSKILGWATHIY